MSEDALKILHDMANLLGVVQSGLDEVDPYVGPEGAESLDAMKLAASKMVTHFQELRQLLLIP